MMQTILDLARAFGLLFLIGLPVLFVISMIIAFAIDGARKRAVKTAKEAGVELILKPDRGPSVTDIQGIGYCIGLLVVGIIFVAASVLGVSLPLDLSENMENVIGTIIFGVFDVLIWSVLIWIPFYYIKERRTLQRTLEDALSEKGL